MAGDLKGTSSRNWKGGRNINSQGYVLVYTPQHPRADRHGYVREHVLVVEAALGRFLKPEEVVHHWNEVKSDNTNENLLLCPDDAYHRVIHQRMRASAACGHADWRKCRYCKTYSKPEEMYHHVSSRSFYHVPCAVQYNKNLKERV